MFTLTKRTVLSAAAAATIAMTAGIGIPLASAATDATGTTYTFDGSNLNVRSDASLDSEVVGSLTDGQNESITCWVQGDSTDNPRGDVTDVWFKVDQGYVSGAFFFQDDPDSTLPQCGEGEDSGDESDEGGSGEVQEGQAGTYGGVELSAEQAGNAATIMSVAQENGFNRDAQIIALMTAMQESTMINLDYGDRDSQGLFQQRPSAGWGTVEQITDPVLASQAFFGVADHTSSPGLAQIDGWENMAKTEAAQAVQVSAFPDAYAKWESMATEFVDAHS